MPAELRAKHGLIPEDEALRAIHLAESQSLRERARERLTFDEAVGLQWRWWPDGTVNCRNPGPRRPGNLTVLPLSYCGGCL